MSSTQRRVRLPSTGIPLRTTTYRTRQRISSASAPKTDPHVTPRSSRQGTRRNVFPGHLHAPVITADSLTLTLPVPPSINHQYATVNGRRLLSSTGRSYKALVSQHVWCALTQSTAQSSFKTRLHSTPLALSIRFFFSSALRRDLDGGLKIAQDAICEGLGLNDNRIIETHLYKHVDKADPRIELSLSLLESSDPS